MGDGDFLLGNVLHQFALSLQGVLAVAGKADAVGHTEHMGVHGQGGEIEYHRGDDVGGFASYTGQGLQIVDVGRYLASKVVPQLAGHGGKVFALVVWVGDGVDVVEDVLGRGFGHCGSIGIGGKERRGGHVHPLVGALCRQDDGNQQLERVLVFQFGLCRGACLLEIGYHSFISFGLCHVSGVVMRFYFGRRRSVTMG